MSNANPQDSTWIAAVEGGGTSFKVAVCRIKKTRASSDAGSSNPLSTIVKRTEVDSSHDRPNETLAACADFLKVNGPPPGEYYSALGLATFGPVGVHASNKDSGRYGHILKSSPKAAWRNVDLLTPLREACTSELRPSTVAPLQVRVETDVNAPALAEYLQIQQTDPVSNSSRSDIRSLAYVTIGTGVGVGLIVNGEPVHGRMHPEGGHVPIQPLTDQDDFQGYSWGTASSPFQGKRTVEGMASSVALTERLEHMLSKDKKQGSENVAATALSRNVLAELPDDHEIWDHAANAIANLCTTLLLLLSIEKIVLGGGVMRRAILLEKIRKRTVELLNGYLELPSDMSTLITTSQFGADAGLVGAIVLAQRAALGQDGKATETKSVVQMKQEAFHVGLYHGIILGITGAVIALKLFFRHRRT